MVQRLDLGALANTSDGKQVAASTDTPVQIALVSLADLAAAVRCVGVRIAHAEFSTMGAC